jgi:hypothetical protein
MKDRKVFKTHSSALEFPVNGFCASLFLEWLIDYENKNSGSLIYSMAKFEKIIKDLDTESYFLISFNRITPTELDNLIFFLHYNS